jgi:acyl-CoA dehydrogenase
MSENRAFFRETVERIVADTLDQNAIEATERRALPGALCAALAENGVTHMLVAEEKGGIGADVGDAVAILRTMGAAAAPGPIVETLLGNKLLADADLDPVEGLIALAFAEDGATTLHHLPWGGLADHILVVTPTGLSLSAAAGWTVTPGLDAADEPRDTLTAGPTGPVTPFDTSAVLRTAAILRAGQILGAIEWTLARSIDYAGERKQFGREISKFQAIQQMLAELADHMLASAVLTEAAAESVSEPMVAAARSRLGDAADAAIAISHQVHGAMGFSREYTLNHRTRRLMAWRDDYGSVLAWRRALAGAFVGCTREGFWPAVSDAGLGVQRS